MNEHKNFRAEFHSFVLKTLKELAHKKVENHNPEIVGVTGSVGKSSFIYLLDAIMKDTRPTKTTFRGNSESGLPLEILEMRHLLYDFSFLNWLLILMVSPFAYLLNQFPYELLIAEMAIDSSKPPKNMEYLLEIIQPHIGVLLSIAPAHTEQFAQELNLGGDQMEEILRAIAHEKGKLVTKLSPKGKAILNIDSHFIRELIPNIEAPVITFGESADADFRLAGHIPEIAGTRYALEHGGQTQKIFIPSYLLSKEYGSTIAGVLATATMLGLDISEAIKKLESRFTLPPGRMSLIAGRNGSTLLDSSYNSSPSALKSMLETVRGVEVQGQKVLILGDMRELGPVEESAHRELVDLVDETGDTIILIGEKMKKYVYPELVSRGRTVKWFEKSLGMGEQLLQDGQVNTGDLVFIKGSQNTIFLEQVVYELMQNPELADELLCRREKLWIYKREKHWQNKSILR